MTAHVPDILINDHQRVKLPGLQLYGVICGNVRANCGWGERVYKFANPQCSALWQGHAATFRLDPAGELELISYQVPNFSTKAQTKIVSEKLSGEFWLVLKPHFTGPRTYVPFKDGKIVEDESAWVIHEPRTGKVFGDEQVADLATRFMMANNPDQVVDEARAFLALPAGKTWLVCLSHRSSGVPDGNMRESTVLVEEATRKVTWATMTETQWQESSNPGRMMLAVFHRIDPLLAWRLVCALGRRLWDRLRWEQERLAIATTERWLDHEATEDDLSDSWFCATGAGCELQSGWSCALELVNEYGGSVVPATEVCDLLRKVLGNPWK